MSVLCPDVQKPWRHCEAKPVFIGSCGRREMDKVQLRLPAARPMTASALINSASSLHPRPQALGQVPRAGRDSGGKSVFDYTIAFWQCWSIVCRELRRAMRTRRKVAIILVVIFAELIWLILRPRISLHGEVLDEQYRRKERFAALVARSQNPSSEAEAAFNREVELLHAHMQRRNVAGTVLLVVLNGVGTCCFLCLWKPRHDVRLEAK